MSTTKDLLNMVMSSDLETRRTSAFIIQDIIISDLSNIDKYIINGLFCLMEDEDSLIRCIAIRSIMKSNLDNETIKSFFYKTVKDVSSDVREEAFSHLWDLSLSRPIEWSILPLIQALEDPSPAVRRRVRDALYKIDNDIFRQLLGLSDQRLNKENDIILDILRKCLSGKYKTRLLLNYFNSNKKLEKRYAILGSSLLGVPAIPYIEKMLDDVDDDVRLDAVAALKRIGPRAASEIEKALDDKSAIVRIAAIDALSGLETEGSMPARSITSSLRDSDPEVRNRAVLALTKIQLRNDELINLLDQTLLDEDALVRSSTLATLIQSNIFNINICSKILNNLIYDINHNVSFNAQNYIDIIVLGRDDGHRGDLAKCLGMALTSADEAVRQFAVRRLLMIGPLAISALNGLILAANDSSEAVQCDAIWTLGNLGADASPALSALMHIFNMNYGKTSKKNILLSIINAIGSMGQVARASKPLLSSVLKAADADLSFAAACALTRVEPRSELPIRILLGFLASPSPDSRIAAAEALGCLGPKALDAIAHLEKLIAIELDEDVKNVAIQSLNDIRSN
jgi:HEAT repeat protein